jgi:hypothetical protein
MTGVGYRLGLPVMTDPFSAHGLFVGLDGNVLRSIWYFQPLLRRMFLQMASRIPPQAQQPCHSNPFHFMQRHSMLATVWPPAHAAAGAHELTLSWRHACGCPRTQ